MRTFMMFVLCIFATSVSAQEVADRNAGVVGDPGTTGTVVIEEQAEGSGSLAKAAELRARVRDMRRSVLGGGPSVESAEREALSFYRRQVHETARKIDELRTDRDVKDAEYRLALDATLSADDAESENRAARRAGKLKKEIGDLDARIADLNRQRTQLGNAVVAIQNRMDRRRRVIGRLEEEATFHTLPFLGETVLGPDDEDLDTGDPLLENDEFFADLMDRDPDKARRMLFLRDPQKYWLMFPLTPPEGVFREAFAHPSQWRK